MYGVIHADGSGEINLPVEGFSDLYDELLVTDGEHPDVSVEHEDTGWCISAYRNGRIIMSSAQGEGRHMNNVPKERVVQLWKRLIEGDIDSLLKEPWKPGYAEQEGA